MSTINQFNTQEELDWYVLGLGQLRMSKHYHEFGISYIAEASGYFEDAINYFKRLISLNKDNLSFIEQELRKEISEEYTLGLNLIKYKVRSLSDLIAILI